MNRGGRVEHIVRFYIEGSDCADMRTYGRSFLEHYDRAMHSLRHMMRIGHMRHARVLDLGCGFGWHALIVCLVGDNEVVANDVRPLMVENIEARVNAVRQRFAIRPRVQTELGDFIELDIPSESYDAIFCAQTIEHIHDLDACFRKAYAVLKPGGRLVISNDNNCLVRTHLEEIEQMWIKRDSSWEFIEQLKRERPAENREIKPYAVMREEIIRREFPKLEAQIIERMVNATAGKTQMEIAHAVETYLADGSLPERPKSSWCRNPITGEFCERQFDPFELKERLMHFGFRVRLLQDLRRGGPLRLLTMWDVPAANRILFRRRAQFVLAARKPT